MIQMRGQVGAVAVFKRAVVANRLLKTRSGKILRKTMRSIADGQEFNTPSTIEDINILGELKDLMDDEKVGTGNS